MDKPIKYYSAILSPEIHIGACAVIVCPDTPPDKVRLTTAVVRYDEETETIETENTVYVPAGPAEG